MVSPIVCSLAVLSLVGGHGARGVAPPPPASVRGMRMRAHHPLAFFGPKGDPVDIAIKTFDGTTNAKGVAGQPLVKAIGSKANIIYGCKSGECGSCEVKLDGRVVRTCVAKLPDKGKVTVDSTQNKLLKSRRNSNW